MRHRAPLSATLLILLVHTAGAQPIPIGGEFQIDTGGLSPQNPSIAANAAGSVAVAWDEQLTRIAGRRYDATGAPQGPESQLNTYLSGNPGRPSVSMGSAGNFVVVWDSVGQDGDGRGIFGQRFDATGSAQGPEFVVNSDTTGEQSAASVAVDASGNFFVVWTGQGVAGDVRGQRFDAAGVPQGPELQVNTYTTGSQYGARVAVDGGGNFVVVWQSLGEDGDGGGVFAQRFDGGGVSLGPEFQVNTYTPADQYGPAVAADPRGNFVVVWTTTGRQDGDASGIIGRRYNASGTPLGNEFHVNNSFDGYQTQPAVAADADGGFVVAWISGIVEAAVVARRFDASGTPLGPDFQVNTDPVEGQGQVLSPAVTTGAPDTFMVVWSRRFDGDRISGRRYAFDAVAGGKKIVIKDRVVTKRSILFRSEDPTLSTATGIGIDPLNDGGYLHVFNNSGGDDAVCFPLPATGWSASGNPTRPLFRYADPGYLKGPCKVVNVRNGRLLKAICKADAHPIAYSLDEAQQGSVGVIFGSGPTRYCTVFGGTIVTDSNLRGRFHAKNAPAPAGCPVPPAACP